MRSTIAVGPWRVEDTPCFPNNWKVIGTPDRPDDNSPANYFLFKKDAQDEADKRNARESAAG